MSEAPGWLVAALALLGALGAVVTATILVWY